MSFIIKFIVTALVVVGVGAGVVLYLKHTPPSSLKPITSDSPTLAYLQIDGISGGSSDAGHTDAIEIKTFDWGGKQGSTGGSLTFSMLSGKASPMLFQALASGKHFPKAILSSSKGDETLEDVVFTSYHQESTSPDSPPVDGVTLTFKKVKIEDTPKDESKILPPQTTTGTTTGTTGTTTGSTGTGSSTLNCGAHGALNAAGSCTCDIAYTWNGQTCAYTPPAGLCYAPRSIDAAGACSCPQGQSWNGELCVTAQTPQCDPPKTWDGRSCVSPVTGPTCNEPRSLNSDGICACPSGQTWNERTCVDVVIQSSGGNIAQ